MSRLMHQEQVIWIAPRATAFTAVCDECLSDQSSPESYLTASVAGALRLDASRGWCTCRRGHEIRIERAHPVLAGVIR